MHINTCYIVSHKKLKGLRFGKLCFFAKLYLPITQISLISIHTCNSGWICQTLQIFWEICQTLFLPLFIVYGIRKSLDHLLPYHMQLQLRMVWHVESSSPRKFHAGKSYKCLREASCHQWPAKHINSVKNTRCTLRWKHTVVDKNQPFQNSRHQIKVYLNIF